ncbi:MAG: hypothetical protein OXC95_00325 [Dehalococcoidia bacterium]|nr:hypothetical protein [Dehalococcoidia bacterium]
MPRHTEPSANNALGILLQGMMGGCSVRSENVRAIVDRPGLQPDILVTAPDRAPVVVEAEYDPARTVEAEARERLGLEVVAGRRKIEAAVALIYPESVADSDELAEALSDTDLRYCVFTTSDGDLERFPESGWLDGSVPDLADLVRLVSVPQEAVDKAATALQDGIDDAVAALDDMAMLRPAITRSIADLLGMSDVRQTRRMACAIIANAMIFHEQISGMHEGVKNLRQVCGDGVADPQEATLDAWSVVLKINYWPIFAIAKDVLEQLPSGEAARILQTLRHTAQRVDAAGVTNAHDLTGRIFQRLIADRKYLATFYTLPASAALLARLAVAKMEGVDWSDAQAIGNLRVGDFACGTGALLSAVYDQIAARHERAGGNPADLHRAMMEEVLYGCDVMPSAIHITGSTLSGMQPNVGFGQSRLYTMPYGRQEDGSVSIGSLEFLQSSTLMTLFNMWNPVLRTGSEGEETAAQVLVEAPDDGFDLVIMNPPFTRATNHEGAHADVTNPAFAAFNATRTDQTRMGSRINQLGRDSCYHGNAGIASAFAALGHKKLRRDGVLAMVLPLSSAAGLSWQKFREMLARDYTDLTVFSIAANGQDMSFSSDTGMAECLVIARKMDKKVNSKRRGHFISLTARPQGFVHASTVAQNIVAREQIRKIEDGPYGGAPLILGDNPSGEAIDAPYHADGSIWGSVRLSDYSLAQTAHALSESRLWLPGSVNAVELSMKPLKEVGNLGLVDRDIIGPVPRGPFDKTTPSPTATYPTLWNHNARNETRMVCAPDSQLRVRQGMEEKAADVWATASHAHTNRDFRFNSQPLAAAFTELRSIGGTAWPSVIFPDTRFDYPFVLWCNSTLGLLLFWWHSNRQQDGRGRITIRSAESLPVLDFRALSDEQLATAQDIFEEFREKELKPAYIADADPNRALLDKRVVCDLLGFRRETYEAVRRLSAKWCAEPSVHGGKRRPRGAGLVV